MGFMLTVQEAEIVQKALSIYQKKISGNTSAALVAMCRDVLATTESVQEGKSDG
jgi:hypothetical protein